MVGNFNLRVRKDTVVNLSGGYTVATKSATVSMPMCCNSSFFLVLIPFTLLTGLFGCAAPLER